MRKSAGQKRCEGYLTTIRTGKKTGRKKTKKGKRTRSKK
jgi:hypothetical protein